MNSRLLFIFRFFGFWGFLLILSFFVSCSGAKDYILMIDTSGSMQKGQRVIEQIRVDIEEFVRQLSVGDKISIMSFDTKAHFHKTYTIQTQKDRNLAVKKVRAFRASGAYTDMEAMIRSLVKTSKKLQDSDRNLYIVVMSDGIDDPPPSVRRKVGALQLELLRKKKSFFDSLDEPYIYYVSVGSLHEKKLFERLSHLSKQTKTIDSSKGGGLSEVREDIEATDLYYIWITTARIVGALALAGLIGFGMFSFQSRHKLKGELLYYDIDIDRSLSDKFSLDKLASHKIIFGKRAGAKMKVRGIQLPQNLILKAYVSKKTPYLRINPKDVGFYSFISQANKAKKGCLISMGDKFQVANFMFEYGKF